MIETQYLVTLSDYNYLSKGLTLYQSLIDTNSNFTLHYLCLDDASFDKLILLNLPYLIPINVSQYLHQDPILCQLKITDRWYYCMSLASYISNKLLVHLDSIIYVDSDIYFHQSINSLVNVIGEAQIAIFRHRQFSLDQPRPEGFYNVGVVYFKNSKFGKKVLSWWSDAVLNKKIPELATCGDQKYLDSFPQLCPEECIYIDGEIGHGAPWQWQLYDWSKYELEGKIIWEGQEQLLYFTHFSQFSHDYNKGTYIPSTMHHIYTPLLAYQSGSLKKIYDNYFKELNSTIKKFKLI